MINPCTVAKAKGKRDLLLRQNNELKTASAITLFILALST